MRILDVGIGLLKVFAFFLSYYLLISTRRMPKSLQTTVFASLLRASQVSGCASQPQERVQPALWPPILVGRVGKLGELHAI
jgi:hypothetical protein